ncbi:MAG: DciA family protein [Gallionellaceae bacterium]|nr:DciA family protein [Gallionellaceae bacterium]MDD5365812.1 DciA family protein [Gallionellaceae bacterium]
MAIRTSFQRIRVLIGQERGLAVLLPEARRLRALNDRLVTVLPRAVAQACQVVAVANGEALVLCGNGSAASRLRSQANSVARALSSEAQTVDRIKVRVQADWARPDRPAKTGLGRGALTAWDELEHKLPDGDLKSAIDRLLDHHRRSR